MVRKPEYGFLGRLGVGTPGANPTVEPEIRRLIPINVEYYSLRLMSSSGDPKVRLIDYLRRLPDFIGQYGSLKLDGFMFACTGSSYLVDAEEEREILASAEKKLHAPIFTAATAVEKWLMIKGARRIGLISPYPEWLQAFATGYWQSKGYELVASASVDLGGDDTSGIYHLSSADAKPFLERLMAVDVDAILISGTGMPSLALLQRAVERGVPTVSSNFALAAQALANIGQKPNDPSQSIIR